MSARDFRSPSALISPYPSPLPRPSGYNQTSVKPDDSRSQLFRGLVGRGGGRPSSKLISRYVAAHGHLGAGGRSGRGARAQRFGAVCGRVGGDRTASITLRHPWWLWCPRSGVVMSVWGAAHGHLGASGRSGRGMWAQTAGADGGGGGFGEIAAAGVLGKGMVPGVRQPAPAGARPIPSLRGRPLPQNAYRHQRIHQPRLSRNHPRPRPQPHLSAAEPR